MGINEVCFHLLRILEIHDAKIIGTRNSHVLTQCGGGLKGENKPPSPINLICSEAFVRQSSIQLWSNNGLVFFPVKAVDGPSRNVVPSYKRGEEDWKNIEVSKHFEALFVCLLHAYGD